MMIWLMSRFPSRGEQQYFDPDDEDMYPPGDGPGGNPDDHQGGQPPGPPPTGSVAGPNQFGNPDVPLEQLGYPSSDPEEAMPEITSESRPPDDPGQPPIGFPSDTDPVHSVRTVARFEHAGARTICSGES